jgi:hypothetical protein
VGNKHRIVLRVQVTFKITLNCLFVVILLAILWLHSQKLLMQRKVYPRQDTCLSMGWPTISNEYCTLVICSGTNSTHPLNKDLHNRQFLHGTHVAFFHNILRHKWSHTSCMIFKNIFSYNPSKSRTENCQYPLHLRISHCRYCSTQVKELQYVKTQTSMMARWVTKICQFGPQDSRSNLTEFQMTSSIARY